MQLKTKMPALLKPFYQSEIAKASELFSEKNIN